MTAHWRDLCRRIGLISMALILFAAATDVWVRGEALRDPAHLILSFLAWVTGIGAFGASLLRDVPRRAAWLVLTGVIGAVLGYAYLSYDTYTPLTTAHTDNEMIAQFAVETLERGENPYTWNYSDMLRVYRDQSNVTPFLDGAYQYRVTYPALPTLVYYAMDRTGLDLGQGEPRLLGLIGFIALLVLIFVGAPDPLRPVILLPLFIFRDYLFASLNGVQDVVWSALLVGVIYAWQRPLWRAALFGLACSFRQQPWFAAPFLLIYLWHEDGAPRARRRRIGFFVAISAGVFVATNLPFFLWNPRAWLEGALEPSYAAFNFRSYGVGILSEYGMARLPREFYTVAQASALAIMLILHWHYAPVIGQGFWIFPGVFFWFYYRGLPSYWAYWIPVMLAALAGGAARALTSGVQVSPVTRHARHAVPLALVTAITFVNVAWGISVLRRAPLVEVSYTPPIETFHTGLANRLHVTVRNRSDQLLTPRFAIRPDYGVQALPWRILSGPEQLAPGESGEYVIDAKTLPSREFKVERGGQVVVTDAGGNYALYATLDIPAQTHYGNPDHIANPDFRYWPEDSAAPLEWALVQPRGSIAIAHLAPFEGRMALAVEATSNPNASALPIVRLQQTVTFPDRFAVWVYPTSEMASLAGAVYGVEINDGQHRLRILFGDLEQEGIVESSGDHVVYRRAPLDAWSRQVIDLTALYAQMGWPQPLATPRFARNIRYSASQVTLSLIVGARTPDAVEWVFGPIEQADGFANRQAVVKSALDHPDGYYVAVGDKYRSERNFDLAETAYLKALDYNAASSPAYFGLGESRFWLDNPGGARAAFQTALDLGYPDEGNARKGIGWSDYNLTRYTESLRQFEAAVSAFLARDNRADDLSLADAYNGAGWSWLRLGDCAQAVSAFGQALDLEPDLPGPKDGLAQCAASGS